MVGDRRQGRAILAAMALLWLASTLVAIYAETGGNPRLAGPADQTATGTQLGGNLEGKEVRLARADRRCWPPARWEPRPGWPAPPWTVAPRSAA